MLRMLWQRLWRALSRIYPRTLTGRVAFMLVVALLFAEVLAGGLWYYQYNKQLQTGLGSTIRSMTQSAVATQNFMGTLPRNYRQLVLTQQRRLGGSNYFVSINRQALAQPAFPEGWLQKEILAVAGKELGQALDERTTYQVNLVRIDELRVFNAGVKMIELPEGWSRFAFPAMRGDTPVLVMQLQLPTREWLFVAAPLPPPYDTIDLPFFTQRQLVFTLTGLLLILLIIWPWLRRELRPVEALAHAAENLNTRLEVPPVAEQGSAEFITAIRAFNQMQVRLRTYLRNRELLFSGISHDLKTPLTRLRLRMEMLDDEVVQLKFERDINDLEMMIKGALQSMKDTDIYENPEDVNIMQWLAQLQETSQGKLAIRGVMRPFRGRPLALRRCIGNLIDNGIKYGGHVVVQLEDRSDCMALLVIDDGPGIPADELEKVFEPYYRLHDDQQGSGLGLAIARNIARNHGGDLTLANRPEGGVIATLILPRTSAEEQP
ncbi:ATP-binding protein [Chitinilyticum aquatile]|uniref:ATP-binding protein n=1 Tax=Chitinilyticum aquatile TaxID=362520 RepID=UPI0003FDAF54|nr:ATP-binding protein [Chitinilyticum aquatile]